MKFLYIRIEKTSIFLFAEANCASTLCGENEYCKTENGVPTCVKKSAVNGECFLLFVLIMLARCMINTEDLSA